MENRRHAAQARSDARRKAAATEEAPDLGLPIDLFCLGEHDARETQVLSRQLDLASRRRPVEGAIDGVGGLTEHDALQVLELVAPVPVETAALPVPGEGERRPESALGAPGTRERTDPAPAPVRPGGIGNGRGIRDDAGLFEDQSALGTVGLGPKWVRDAMGALAHRAGERWHTRSRGLFLPAHCHVTCRETRGV